MWKVIYKFKIQGANTAINSVVHIIYSWPTFLKVMGQLAHNYKILDTALQRQRETVTETDRDRDREIFYVFLVRFHNTESGISMDKFYPSCKIDYWN